MHLRYASARFMSAAYSVTQLDTQSCRRTGCMKQRPVPQLSSGSYMELSSSTRKVMS